MRTRMFFHEFKKWCLCLMCIFKTIRTTTFLWILMFPSTFFISETDSWDFDFSKKKMFNCENKFVKIQNWKWINIYLWNEWWFILSKIIYIVSFSINLIFLTRLQNRDIKWNHVMKNITYKKITKIIDCIVCHSNNYQINEKFSSNVFYNSFSVFVFMRTVDSTAFANVWHHWMNHLKPLGLHHLNKKCLGVKLKNFNMSQCDVCAKVKMINQIFHHSSINRFIRSFYKINIDWKNLNENWNNYQSDETIIKQIIKIICQITNITITYFIFIWKKMKICYLFRI